MFAQNKKEDEITEVSQPHACMHVSEIKKIAFQWCE